jgi:hypothetical protein
MPPTYYLKASRSRGPSNGFYTDFPQTESSLSQGGAWLNGLTVGQGWIANMQTTAGLAWGTQSGGAAPPGDSTAILTGSWPNDQRVIAKVKTVNQQTGNGPTDTYEELELRVRARLYNGLFYGYGVNIRCQTDSTRYVQMSRWDGDNTVATGPAAHFAGSPLGGPNLPDNTILGPGLVDGDLMMLSMIGTSLQFSIQHNGVWSVVNTITDAVYASGAPGIAHWYHGALGAANDFGFRNFSAMAT